MSQEINKIVLSLLEAKVTLYPASPTGAPVLTAPIWTGAPAEKLNVRERWRIKETTPTAAKFPRKHPLVPDYDITIDRVWLLDKTDLTGWAAGWQNYVLDVVWTEEESGEWHRRTFYGVTINERGLETREIDSGFTDDQVFAAQYFVASSGSGYPPDIASDLPYTVRFTGADGVSVLLYAYDPATHLFAAQASLTNRATLTDGQLTGIFSVTFAPDASPTLLCQNGTQQNFRTSNAYRTTTHYRSGAGAALLVPSLRATVPMPAELPRLDFFYGSLRTATLTRSGLYDVRFTETAGVAPGAGKFALYANSALIATLAAGEVQAKDFLVL